MTTSLLASVELAPRDPILGINEAFASDTRATKVNLGVGVYYDDEGKIPLLKCVQAAEKAQSALAAPRGYLPIDGIAQYDHAVLELLLGSDAFQEGLAVTVQALGGTGALRIGADFLKRVVPEAEVLISDPSWENHRAIFEAAGFRVGTYPYYDAASHGIHFEALRQRLDSAAPGSVVVMHACCHNPTGVDLTEAQWKVVFGVVKERGLVPFLDIAYQGFGSSLHDDALAVRMMKAAALTGFIASSFSKSFSLYGERVGALTAVTQSKTEAERVLSQLKRVIRSNYSNPPTHGGRIVADILTSPELRNQWQQELEAMRLRIRAMRQGLVDGIKRHGSREDFGFVLNQRGMFSYSGLTAAQVERLRADYGIYAVSSGRICVAALNAKNLDYVCGAIAAVIEP